MPAASARVISAGRCRWGEKMSWVVSRALWYGCAQVYTQLRRVSAQAERAFADRIDRIVSRDRVASVPEHLAQLHQFLVPAAPFLRVRDEGVPVANIVLTSRGELLERRPATLLKRDL